MPFLVLVAGLARRKRPSLIRQLLCVPHALRASLYIVGVWIRQPKELEMKRLLLVMGMVGCGGVQTRTGVDDVGS